MVLNSVAVDFDKQLIRRDVKVLKGVLVVLIKKSPKLISLAAGF